MRIWIRRSHRRALCDNRGRLLGIVAALLIALAGLLLGRPADGQQAVSATPAGAAGVVHPAGGL
jgi:hypothetical protein